MEKYISILAEENPVVIPDPSQREHKKVLFAEDANLLCPVGPVIQA